MLPPSTGHELPFLFLGAFRRLIDELHDRLKEVGHPDLRPAHAVTLQAIGPSGSRASDVADAVGITKQAVAKTLARLEELDYVRRNLDPSDHRARIITLTARGLDAITQSGQILAELAQGYAQDAGESRFLVTIDVLRTVRGDAPAFEQFERWFGRV